MLSTLDRDQRLAYIPDTVFDLPSRNAAGLVGVTPAAYPQRLARSRAKMNVCTMQTCGLVNADAVCPRAKQLPAPRHIQHVRRLLKSVVSTSVSVIAIYLSELAESERHFDSMLRIIDAAALFRTPPEYRVPTSMRGAIHSVPTAEGLMTDPRPPQ